MQTSYIYYLVFNWQSRLILIQPLLPTHFGTVVIRQLRPEFEFPVKIDLAFSQILAMKYMIQWAPKVSRLE